MWWELLGNDSKANKPLACSWCPQSCSALQYEEQEGKGEPGVTVREIQLCWSYRGVRGFQGRLKNDSVVERPNVESDKVSLMLALQAASKVNRGELHNISEPQIVI